MRKPETVTFGGRQYRKFIRWPKPVRDGTVRCFACGQIDEFEIHDIDLCPATRGAVPAGEAR